MAKNLSELLGGMDGYDRFERVLSRLADGIQAYEHITRELSDEDLEWFESICQVSPTEVLKETEDGRVVGFELDDMLSSIEATGGLVKVARVVRACRRLA